MTRRRHALIRNRTERRPIKCLDHLSRPGWRTRSWELPRFPWGKYYYAPTIMGKMLRTSANQLQGPQ
eukprot:SAG31_NODE_8002_length_1543_cov_2.851801_1_plen_66_part_01